MLISALIALNDTLIDLMVNCSVMAYYVRYHDNFTLQTFAKFLERLIWCFGLTSFFLMQWRISWCAETLVRFFFWFYTSTYLVTIFFFNQTVNGACNNITVGSMRSFHGPQFSISDDPYVSGGRNVCHRSCCHASNRAPLTGAARLRKFPAFINGKTCKKPDSQDYTSAGKVLEFPKRYVFAGYCLTGNLLKTCLFAGWDGKG